MTRTRELPFDRTPSRADNDSDMFQDLEVIDFHAHFPVPEPAWEAQRKAKEAELGERRTKIAREYAVAYNTDWRLAWDYPAPERERQTDEQLAKRWVGDLDKYGISRICWMTAGGNENMAKVCAMYPDRFVGFAHHDPFGQAAADELERCVTERGFRGYKLIGPQLERPITDKSAYPTWEVCAAHKIPVLVHFGILGSGGGIANQINMNPLVLHDVAKAFPDVDFIVPHFGCGYITDTLMLCWACRNVHIDTSGSNQWVKWVQGDVTVKDLFRKYLETIGPERILFGTDSSWFPRGFAIRYLQDQLRDLRDLNTPHASMALIFAGNAKRLLKLPA